jgi:hypothetical protein
MLATYDSEISFNVSLIETGKLLLAAEATNDLHFAVDHPVKSVGSHLVSSTCEKSSKAQRKQPLIWHYVAIEEHHALYMKELCAVKC